MDPCATCFQPNSSGSTVKGQAVTVFSGETGDRLSDVAVDLTNANALSVQVLLSGANASATVSVEGGPSAGGLTLPVSDPNGSQIVTQSKLFDVIVGSPFARVRLSSVVGAVTVICTPYVAPGPSQITATVG